MYCDKQYFLRKKQKPLNFHLILINSSWASLAGDLPQPLGSPLCIPLTVPVYLSCCQQGELPNNPVTFCCLLIPAAFEIKLKVLMVPCVEGSLCLHPIFQPCIMVDSLATVSCFGILTPFFLPLAHVPPFHRLCSPGTHFLLLLSSERIQASPSQ